MAFQGFFVQPMSETIIERLRAGQLVRVMHFSGLSSPKLVEVAGILGDIHGLWIDQEHSAVPHAQLELMLIACRAVGLDAFARVPPTDYATIMRPMEAGCSGVMIAQVRALAEVEQAVAWAKYPPRGVRGLFSATAEAGYGSVAVATHVATANRDRWLAIQIETVEGVEIVEQIAAADGVDMLFVGPADLSVTLGVPGDFLHPKCVAALERVAAACKRADKPWGVLSRDAEHARKCRELGCQLFSIFGDLDCFRSGLKALEERFADVLG
jgi:2-dehydro-3-deoxyglucarate aldolase/4-hydroxy-2-oxoheptanedioate aldolase